MTENLALNTVDIKKDLRVIKKKFAILQNDSHLKKNKKKIQQWIDEIDTFLMQIDRFEKDSLPRIKKDLGAVADAGDLLLMAIMQDSTKFFF